MKMIFFKQIKIQVFFVFFLFFRFSLISQNQFSFSDFSQNNSKISAGIYGDGFLNSNSLNNNFFRQFNKNGFISDEIKKENSQNIFVENRIGADLNYGIFYSQKLDSSFGFFINISDRAHLNSKYSPDFFELVFYGNKMFAGDTAILDNTSINFLRYQQFQTGFFTTDENGKRFGFGLSFLKGEENFSMEIRKGQLFTHEFGESLSLNFQGEINRSDTSSKGINAFNGTGFSADLFFEFPYETKFFKGKFKAEGNDIGFIQWNKNSIHLKKDTSVFFDGIYISDIFQLNDSVMNAFSSDSIQQQIESFQINKKYKTHLPAMLKLHCTMETDKFLFSLGINNRFNANYTTFFQLKSGWKAASFLTVSANAGYGGYGNYCFGAETSLNLKNFHLTFGSNNLEGIFFPDFSGGNSAYVSLRKSFN